MIYLYSITLCAKCSVLNLEDGNISSLLPTPMLGAKEKLIIDSLYVAHIHTKAPDHRCSLFSIHMHKQAYSNCRYIGFRNIDYFGFGNTG